MRMLPRASSTRKSGRPFMVMYLMVFNVLYFTLAVALSKRFSSVSNNSAQSRSLFQEISARTRGRRGRR